MKLGGDGVSFLQHNLYLIIQIALSNSRFPVHKYCVANHKPILLFISVLGSVFER